MTADEIRALVLQVFADARLASETFIADDGYMSTAFRSNEDAAQAAVEAMAAAGVLPTGVKWRVHPCDCQPCAECEAEALADGAARQRRYVGPWREVTD